MDGLPSLHNLSIGKDVGVQLTFATKGAADTVNRKVTTFNDRGPGKSAPGAARMEELIADLKNKPKLVDEWRRAILTNMVTKSVDYGNMLVGIQEDILKEQELQLRMVQAARRPLEQVLDHTATAKRAGVPQLFAKEGGYSEFDNEARHDLYQRVENTAMTDLSQNKWDVVDKERWQMLNLKVEAIAKLVEAIDQRKRTVLDLGPWASAVARFITSLQTLLDYPEQTALLDRVVDTVRAFIHTPKFAANQFVNVMIMGVAGTGKTRLAEALGTVLAQLGLYVYDEFIEASVGDFIAGFVGQTEAKVVTFLTKNAEKVLFLDEAYALTTWNEEHTVLTNYAPEAVAELIAFLSKNVGKMAFIVAGYEDKMMQDFLPANEGFDRRFPIRATLGDYEPQTLYKIFVGAIAISFQGVKPPSLAVEQRLEWEKQLFARTIQVYGWFRDSAAHMLFAVIKASREKLAPTPAAVMIPLAFSDNRDDRFG